MEILESIYKTESIEIFKHKDTVKKYYKNHSEFVGSLNIFKKIKDNPHPNVIPVLEINEEKQWVRFPFYEKGDMINEIEKVGIERINKKKIIMQCANGLKHLHMLGISHNDLKLDNIFIDDKRNYVIGDIEESKGTLLYLSPERYKSNRKGSMKDDIWALGIIIYNLYYNEYPFERTSMMCSEYRKFTTRKYSIFEEKEYKTSLGTKKLILGLLQNESDRLTIDDVIKYYDK